MSIEKTIEDLTAAVVTLNGTIQKLVTVGAVQAAGFAKSPEAAFKAAEAQAAVSEKPKTEKPKAQAQAKAKADKTDKELIDEVLEEAENDDGLPAGERDAAYYEKHVRPHFMALADANRDAAITVLDGFGVKTAKALEPAKWGALVTAVKDKLAELNGGADEDDLG